VNSKTRIPSFHLYLPIPRTTSPPPTRVDTLETYPKWKISENKPCKLKNILKKSAPSKERVSAVHFNLQVSVLSNAKMINKRIFYLYFHHLPSSHPPGWIFLEEEEEITKGKDELVVGRTCEREWIMWVDVSESSPIIRQMELTGNEKVVDLFGSTLPLLLRCSSLIIIS